MECTTNLFKNVEKVGDKVIDERLKLDHANIQAAMDPTYCFSYIIKFAISSAFMVAKKDSGEGEILPVLQTLKVSLSELTYIVRYDAADIYMICNVHLKILRQCLMR